MNRKLINRLYWGFWSSTTLLVGILTGYFIAHSLLLGPFFTWFIESDKISLLQQTFSIYKATPGYAHLYGLYYVPLLLSLISGGVWTILAFILKRDRVISIIAGLPTYFISIAFFATGFTNTEQAVMSGVADAATYQLFASENVPLHTSFAVIHAISFSLLLMIALKEIRSLYFSTLQSHDARMRAEP
jgi:hypothetical protein